MSDMWNPYDPYAPNQGLADPSQDDWSFLYQLMGAPQYSDPNMGVPGDTFSQRMTALKNIEGLIGVPLTQLLGNGSVSYGNEPEPMLEASQTGAVYGSNPLFKDAFKAIDGGVDPQSVFQEVQNKAKQYGINFAPGSQEFQDWADRTFSVINNYAFESYKNKSEYEKQASEYSPDETFKLGNKTYQGRPDINGFASEYDLMGAPDVDSLMRQASEARMRKRNPKETDAILQERQNLVNHRNVMAPDAQGQLIKREGALGENADQQRWDRWVLTQRTNQAKQNMVRSDANAQTMRKIAVMRALMGA